ncbi:MAG TPA: VOC family protein [Chitinophagaceae bacterium]|nr:VOC family protein [Chitinophagaceae bacterium]
MKHPLSSSIRRLSSPANSKPLIHLPPRLLLFACIIITQLCHAQTRPMPRLNHIAIYVVDLEKSTRFYRDIIGLDTIPEPFHDGRHTWFSIGSKSQLHIISGAANSVPHDKNAHLCFSVSSIDQFITNLNKHQIPYEDWAGKQASVTSRVDGVKQIWFKDPDGYWIEANNANNTP